MTTKVNYNQVKGAPVNIMDYGASPSASAATNTAAIIAAIAAADYAVFVPEGIFVINATIPINRDSLTIFGTSSVGSCIEANGAFPIFTLASDTSVVTLEGFQLRHLYLKNGTNGISCVRSSGTLVNVNTLHTHDVRFYGTTAPAIYFSGTKVGHYLNEYTDTVFFRCAGSFFMDAIYDLTTTRFQRCRFEESSVGGIYIETTSNSCVQVTIDNCRFETTTGTTSPIQILGGCQAVCITRNYFETTTLTVPQMTFSSLTGLTERMLIEQNYVSANATYQTVITFIGQANYVTIVNNAFRPNQAADIVGDALYCFNFIVYGNSSVGMLTFPAAGVGVKPSRALDVYTNSASVLNAGTLSVSPTVAVGQIWQIYVGVYTASTNLALSCIAVVTADGASYANNQFASAGLAVSFSGTRFIVTNTTGNTHVLMVSATRVY